ncbi:ABC-2 type transport system ATP-binding protein [Ereboglobus sp. PH5-5]|uniref:ABC transporter ATP-binding protein n=1 Tax=Ereboglobus sp. PH5-5 TaxID=2940529 RepID=UPI00240652E9|nr:ABC transporter ATP-binding protein [Ereboglobus sp. PH5-5]MDF9833753.1 ABC-2 type transport system ATP-binding protein [Ereboglobus sp. PH5-5]
MSADATQPDSLSPAIEVQNLVKSYAGFLAVNNVSFTVRRGEILGFLGPNGAGKSTTMRILTGYLPATSGVARVCGVPVATRPEEVKRLIGYMPENNPLPEDMRVSEYLYYRGRLKELGRRKLSSRINEVMELCDLGRERHRIIGKLSKGFRQRVGIAEAILAEPPVIIMDEPTIGLDPHQIQLVRDLIDSLRGNMSVIISSHILPEIEVTCDRVLIINQGRIVTMGTPAELRRDIIGHSVYKLEIACDVEQLGPALAVFEPSIKISETSAPDADGFRIIYITTDRDEPIGESLLQLLRADDRFRLRGLSRENPTLEDVFLVATRRSRDIIDAPKKPRR